MTTNKDCIHCGTPFHPETEDSEFCCGGCEVVYGLLFDEGLDRFYSLKGDRKVRPAKERPFQPAEVEWIEALIEKSEGESADATATVHVSGATCVGCVWLIETLFHRHPGSVSASVDPAGAEGTFTWKKGSGAFLEFAKELPRYGYALDSVTSDRVHARESTRLLPRLGVCAAFALNTMAFTLPRYLGMDDSFQFARIFDLVALVSATLTLLIGGSYFFQKAIGAVRQKMVHIDLPIALGLALAFLGSCIGWLAGNADLFFFDFVAIFTTLMLAGRYIHLLAIEQVSQRLQGQSAMIPEVTLPDNTRKATSSLAMGDIFDLPPGRALPVAARLESDNAEFSLAWMTGEPAPRLFNRGANVSAGAMLLANEPARFLAREDYGDSMVSKLYESVRKPTEDASTSKFLKVYLVLIILIGLTAGASWILAGNPLIQALQVTISIFVISCPCAIGVALPLVERRISTVMARHGVFIQQARFWQNMMRLKHVILDKTGTLTLEHPVLKDTAAIESLSPIQRSALSLLTADSIHPLDRTLQQQLTTKGHIDQSDEAESEMTPGVGNSLTFQGHHWTLGKVGWLGKENFSPEDTTSLSCEFSCDGISIWVFEFGESLRPDAIASADSLKKRGLDLHILSGDSQNRIHEFAVELGIPAANAHGELSPDQKEVETSRLQPGLYLGDGMNDASAFASSVITGTPVTDRSMLDRRASFIFTCQSLSFLPKLFDAAQWTCLTTRLIIAFTLCYNAVAITTCCLGKMTPLLAAILMPISSIISIGISLRPINRKSKLSKI